MLGPTVFWVYDLLKVVVGFHTLGFPQCTGALDRTHIPITCPPCSGHPYYSWWGFHSIMVQAVINHHSAFMNVSTCWEGSVYNICIFCNSALLALVESGRFTTGVVDLQLGAVVFPPLLIRDPTYQLLSWLMQAYTACQARFNQCLGWTQALMECTFGWLKGCWCILTACRKVAKANIPWVISTACITAE
ncbi:hypothetical protein Y1Q_0007373 [Alligator mississippiensis]|uniref:DDE Tnp4 domain-containing protein n=1 Tax=Alligator mississippiensis TaxID=8496 RepID=A0A151P7S5_ALLMI|nr:hypothetical protein Y1Q_0007373 [Alligator mississippiensis]